MKNRTLLSLIEMLLMVMVFAVASAICLRAFVRADRISRDGSVKAEAALLADSYGALFKEVRGDAGEAAERHGGTLLKESDGPVWMVCFDREWNPVPETEAVYILRAKQAEGAASGGAAQESGYLGEGTVTVVRADGEELFAIPVCWQKG